MRLFRPVVNEQPGWRLGVEAPVIPVDFNGHNAGRWQVVGQPRYEEVGEIGQSRVVADDHEVIEAIILRDDGVQDFVERSKVQRVLALQEL